MALEDLFKSAFGDQLRRNTSSIGRGYLPDPMQPVYDAILGSNLPRDTGIVQNVMNVPTGMYPYTSGSAKLNPELVHQVMNNYAGVLGEEFPATLRGLQQVGPTGSTRQFAAFEAPKGDIGFWQAKLRSGATPEEIAGAVARHQASGFFTGQGVIPETGTVRAAAADPIQALIAHEAGHAAHLRLHQWALDPEHGLGTGFMTPYHEFTNQLILENSDPRTAFSRYATGGMSESIASRLKDIDKSETSRIANLEHVKAKLDTGTPLVPKDLEGISLVDRRAMAGEPFAEMFATPRMGIALRPGEELGAGTARAMSKAGELEGLLDVARGKGFVGAASPELLARMALPALGWAGADWLAQKLPNKHTRSLSRGALAGAGIGSMIAPGVGTAIGAGLGALGAQVFG